MQIRIGESCLNLDGDRLNIDHLMWLLTEMESQLGQSDVAAKSLIGLYNAMREM